MRSKYEDVRALNTRVVIISFGTVYWGQIWLQETQVPFLLLLDQTRGSYRAYGLERSLLRSWGPKIIWQYVRLLLSGRRWRGIQGDSGQLGGDFIIDTNGILRFTHPSRDPADRPSMDQLLAVLGELHT